jgi:hypothetical protein
MKEASLSLIREAMTFEITLYTKLKNAMGQKPLKVTGLLIFGMRA